LTGGHGIDLDAAQTVAVPIIGMTGRIVTVTNESHAVANDTAAIITLPGNYAGSTFAFGSAQTFHSARIQSKLQPALPFGQATSQLPLLIA
jgi:hypothetical protein